MLLKIFLFTFVLFFSMVNADNQTIETILKETVINLNEPIKDEINLLSIKDKESLEKRLKIIEENQGVRYLIFITEEPYEFEKVQNDLKDILIINIYKKDHYTLTVKLKFAENIDISTYKNEIENLLERVNILVGNEYYIDLIYELTGNINDIITLIKREESEIKKAEFNRKIKLTSFVLFLFFSLLTIFLMLIRKHILRRLKKCKYCSIEMELCENEIEGKKSVKTYKCKICGYTRKITSSRY